MFVYTKPVFVAYSEAFEIKWLPQDTNMYSTLMAVKVN